MGDVGEDYRAYREYKKEVRQKNFFKWIDIMDEIGARKLTAGVYRWRTWDLYPQKEMGRNFRTKKWETIEKILEEVKK